MSTSELSGSLYGMPTTAASVSGLPMRTSTCRGIINNINHIADQRGRVLVSMVSNVTGRIVGESFEQEWERAFTFGPIPLKIGTDGLPYPIRVRVGGYSASNGELANLRIGICPIGPTVSYMGESTVTRPSVYETGTFTDNTDQWRGAVTILYPDEEFMAAATRVEAVYNTLATDPSSMMLVMANIEVWGWCDTLDGVYITKAYAAEYCGV